MINGGESQYSKKTLIWFGVLLSLMAIIIVILMIVVAVLAHNSYKKNSNMDYSNDSIVTKAIIIKPGNNVYIEGSKDKDWKQVVREVSETPTEPLKI